MPIHDRAIAHLRELLVECRGQEGGFAAALAEIGHTFDANKAIAFIPSYNTADGYAVDYIGWRADELHQTAQDFAISHAEMDPWRVAAERKSGFRHTLISAGEDLLTPAEFDASPWSNFFRAHDIRHLLGVSTAAQAFDTPPMAVSMFHSRRQGHFDDEAKAAFTALVPEIQASVEVYLSLSDAKTPLDAAFATIADPAFLIGRGGLMIWANQAGLAAIARGAEVTAHGNRLRAAADHLDGPVATMIARGLRGQSGVLRLSPRGPRHLVLRATPIVVDERRCVIVRLRDLRAAEPPLPLVLIAAFDFSPAEVEVAYGLIAHQTAGQIAKARARDVETVRKQMRTIYEKLGVRRAGEAAAIMMRLSE